MGETGGLDDLIERLWTVHKLFLYACARDSGVRSADIEGVVQNALLRIKRADPDCVSLDALKGYAIRAIRSAAADRVRRSAHIDVLADEELRRKQASRRSAPSAEDVALVQEECDRSRRQELWLRQAIEDLPEDWRSILVLRYLSTRDLMSFAKIGRRLGRTEDAVRSCHRRALAHLRKRKGGSGGGGAHDGFET